jgi:hypothetical protein
MLPEDQIIFLIGMALLVILSYPIRFIKAGFYRNTYSLVLGALIQFCVFGRALIATYIQIILVYLIIKNRKGKKCGALITI